MTLAAIDAVEDAVDASRQFLLPVDAGRWIRMAVVAFFVSTAGGAGSGASGGGGGGGGGGGNGAGSGVVDGMGGIPFVDARTLPAVDVPDWAIAAVLAVVLLLLVVAIVFAVIGSIMEFVLVESLRAEAVHLRRYTRRYWRGGLRLFGFRLVVTLLAVAVVLVVVLGLLAAVGVFGPGEVGPIRLVSALLVGLPVVLVVAIAAALVLGLTRDFVVPVMLLEGTTVLGGWRRFWPTLRGEWREYAVYVVVSFVLRLVVGVAVGVVVGVVALALLVPLGLVAAAGVLAAGGQLGPAAWVGLGLLVLAAVLVIVAISAVVQVPVVTYFRYYGLLVLGDTEADFDVVAERRAAIRGGAAAE